MDMPNPAVAAKADPLTKFFIKITGTNEETLRLCPSEDWDNVRAIGWIMSFTAAYQASILSIIGHRLFAAPGQFRPEVILASIFIACFIMLIDSYMVMRSGWHLSGIEELKRGGLDVSGGPAARIKAAIFLTIRIALAAGVAQLTAVFLSILIFSADIVAKVEATYKQANAVLVAVATQMVGDEITRATEAVRVQGNRVGALADQLSALRQKQIDAATADPQEQQIEQEIAQLVTQRAAAIDAVRTAETFASDEAGGIKRNSNNSGQVGDGSRHKAALEDLANARHHAGSIARMLVDARTRLADLRKQDAAANDNTKRQAQARLPEFERDFADENAKLAALKDQLKLLTQGREDAIRAAVERAPDHVPVNNGLLAQIVALESVARSDSKIAAVILLIDFVAFGFELAAVLAKVTSFVPTTYSAILARDAYLRVVQMVDDMMKVMDKTATDSPVREPEILPRDEEDGDSAEHSHATGETVFGFEAGSAEPARRPRGRPRKSPTFPALQMPNGQDGHDRR